MTRPASDPTDGAPTRRKATLFCWECDHSSPVDGDWDLRSRNQRVAYVCPVCETTLAERPRATTPRGDRPTAGPITAWRHALRASATIWRASVDAGLSSLAALSGIRLAANRQHHESG
ncbi:hypothetical protein [Natrinema sp. 1APR25-10V2]|uniref:hypothetical protein n=1 Tax=Natrinema sp. 1APR25-10V2 TaxID=2951081 RepID=UPI002875795C|nr:hypothetical protein [Natrinema sp. 1APR25-10V2]MDS0478551.1 hypothetical protein [Natrinema sp. 1APR25-10V2]